VSTPTHTQAGSGEAQRTSVIAGAHDHDLGDAVLQRRERHLVEELRARRHPRAQGSPERPVGRHVQAGVQARLGLRIARP